MMKIEGPPAIDVDRSEEIAVAVRADDLIEGDPADPKRHPIAIALRRQDDVDEARVTKNETPPTRSIVLTTPDSARRLGTTSGFYRLSCREAKVEHLDQLSEVAAQLLNKAEKETDADRRKRLLSLANHYIERAKRASDVLPAKFKLPAEQLEH